MERYILFIYIYLYLYTCVYSQNVKKLNILFNQTYFYDLKT